MSTFSRLFWVLLPLLLPQLLFSQDKKDFGFKFYGQVRADLFYNSRSNSETVDGLFYMYPKDHSYDADGNAAGRRCSWGRRGILFMAMSLPTFST